MTELNKQLAQALGIPAKYKKGAMCDYTQKQCMCNLGSYCTNCEKKEVFPDFTKPSNFVKLVTLSCFRGWILELGQPIECLFDRIIGFLGCDELKEEREDIKQQAQQIDWEY